MGNINLVWLLFIKISKNMESNILKYPFYFYILYAYKDKHCTIPKVLNPFYVI